ncbi:nucleotide exchange factor GrpE [Periweissella beninensis]|uniref:Protein GrpE n=1 Tax=Periweissella beninensis TaxID=504936 RepID=A0ABT0VIF0_9LACO|nr:nucleotide exchange factor GrpE [Periweissella beninensis]MBM7544183.1 molecular chaperone GrpE [Periweissella beninensis]MCM2437609.1 nucleotide exchange factor GrpE [Periweissella beninensis]MCT4396644.1 nucleotide exchange factor GrpE [Periweissella beninensis]
MAEQENKVDDQNVDEHQAEAEAETVATTEEATMAEQAEQVVENTSDKQIADLENKVSDMEDRYFRAQAEMDNMQKRFKKEQEALLKYEGTKLAKSILPAIDNLERALTVEADDAAAKQLKTGVEMVLKTLKQALKDNAIEAVGEIGDVFDPNYHQAIQSVDADEKHATDTIVAVMQKGYVLKDRVIRPAMVSVAQ